MKNLFEKYHITISENQKEKFDAFYRLISEENEKVNLTAIVNEDDFFIKHVLDSLTVLPFLTGKNMIDVGSGGGFPGIPVAIMREDLNVTLLDATGKKCLFLEKAAKELDLKKVTVLCGRAEELSKSAPHREGYDICTARAVARLNTLTEYCLPFVKVGGVMVAMKGDAEEEIKEAANAIAVLGGKTEEVKTFNLEENKRTIVVIKKEKPTPPKYPRGNGKERKKPL